MSYAVIQSKMPSQISAGESLSWKWSDSRFPATDWTLTYSLVSPTDQLQIAADADGSEHLVELTSSETAAYVSGQYAMQAHVAKGEERYKVADGTVTIVADFAVQGGGYDARSHVKKVLDALEASIEQRASKTQIQQTVGGVQIQHMTMTEQIELRDKYAMKYRKEQARKNGISSRRTITARFPN